MFNTIIQKILRIFTTSINAAQSISGTLSDEINQNAMEKITDEKTFVQWIINISIPLGVTCAFVLLVYAGYMMVTSQGNPDKLQESREVITNAVIGFVVVILAVTLLYLIKDSLGLSF
jgi:hypothetical protein